MISDSTEPLSQFLDIPEAIMFKAKARRSQDEGQGQEILTSCHWGQEQSLRTATVKPFFSRALYFMNFASLTSSWK